MRFLFEFDKEKVEALDSTVDIVYNTIKELFLAEGLVCLADGDTLEFGDVGGKDDYGNMWSIVLMLVKTDWFCKCATQCVFFEDEDDTDGEDVLAQADKIRK